MDIKTLKDIPQVEKVLADPALNEAIDKYSRSLLTILVRNEIGRLRERVKSGKAVAYSVFMDSVLAEVEKMRLRFTNRVVNATGILVHTNLGRAPLGENPFEHLKAKISGYSSLEFDLDKGERGSRGAFLFELLSSMTGAEAGIAVNNNAAAVMLILNTFGLGKKCIVSRGEQVQIGGGFRMPDVAVRSGVHLVEIGTTNRTVIEDYRQAIDSDTSIIFKVHLSNFKLVGFTEEASLAELVELGHEKGLTVVHDLGSGAFLETSKFGLSREPTIHDSLSAGADIVCFSGDKLFGGAQAGIILGKKDKIAAIKKNPLYRTVRLDKMVIAVLEELIVNYLKGDHEKIPLINMLALSTDDLRKRADAVQKELALGGIETEVIETEAFCGGGSLPEESFPSVGLKLTADRNVTAIAKRLRLNDPPIVGRIKDDCLILDIRTVFPAEDKLLVEALKRAIK